MWGGDSRVTVHSGFLPPPFFPCEYRPETRLDRGGLPTARPDGHLAHLPPSGHGDRLCPSSGRAGVFSWETPPVRSL